MNLVRSNIEYKVKLADFEGPLDLLLHLIREAKLDIKTIQLSMVTAQYMSFLHGLNDLDLDLASEFIEVGSTLMEIKSKQILPKEKNEPVLTEEEIETRLKAQLEEYKLLKEASEKLKLAENVDRFYKPAAQLKVITKYTMEDLSIEALVSAFQKIMHKIEQKAAPIKEKQIRMDRFTVADKMEEIRTRFRNRNLKIPFAALFENDFSKSEVINTFLALLELLKNQEIVVAQEQRFGEITLMSKEFDEATESSQTYTIVEGILD
ncbi:MAG: segregation/condensation protein A [Firmicutes bacterium]|nr:segregation/condensation protein A [Bacillota bacterium]